VLLARYYDALVDWDRRLASEMPFLKKVLPGPRVLVAACGTGGHVAALAREGFQAVGIDADAEMVEIARSKGAGRVERLEMECCSSLGERFDAVLCLGNVLPNLAGPNQMELAVQETARVLAPGGMFLTQNLNYDKRWRERARFFPLLSGRCGEDEVVLFKFADYGGWYIDFHAVFLVRRSGGGAWEQTVETTRQRPVFETDLRNACRGSGFGKLEAWGSYAGEPFDPQRSGDLLLAAWK
jgi:glycine/sarcosine N-methyltransferase